MEEGDDKGLCLDEYNKDHLATAVDSLKKEEVNETKWLASGFNGFRQFKFEKKRKLLQFKEIQIPFNNNSNDLFLACSWNCFAIACECSVYIQGFVTNCTGTVKSIKTESPIKFLDLCDKFCLLLTENGKVYKTTHESESTCYEVKFQTILGNFPRKRNVFGEDKNIDIKIAHVACGNNISVAVSTTNVVFSGTIEIFQFPKHQRIKQLKCGFEHTLLLTSNGDIYSWGNGLYVSSALRFTNFVLNYVHIYLRRGQLGSNVLRIEETPILIEALAGIKITSIAAGGWHSAAISAFDDVYTWGFNSNGQLSLRVYKNSAEILKEPSVYPLPQLIDIKCHCNDNSCHPVNIAAGARHTVLKMSCGSIYGCGWNEYGQLGLKNSQSFSDNFQLMLKLKDQKNSNYKKLICGNWCTLIEK